MESIRYLDDEQIIRLFQMRDETAVREIAAKYGRYCFVIAYNILEDEHDTEECINDTWLKLWNAIPPKIPSNLKFYVGSITRNLALNKYRDRQRIRKQFQCILDEIDAFLENTSDITSETEKAEFIKMLNDFLRTLPKRDRNIFIRRYYYAENTASIARRYYLKEANVLVILSRTRKKLKQKLIKEGYAV